MSMQHISFEADYAAGGVYYITLETEDDDPSNDWDFVVLAQRNETAVISGALDMGTEAGTVDITLKQGDTVVKQIISAGSFSLPVPASSRWDRVRVPLPVTTTVSKPPKWPISSQPVSAQQSPDSSSHRMPPVVLQRLGT